MGVEERELLMAGNDINRVIDAERHAFGRRGTAWTTEFYAKYSVRLHSPASQTLRRA